MGVRYYILALVALMLGCADDIPSAPPTANVIVRNRSQFELLEMRFHPTPSYVGAANALSAPLGVEESLPIVFENGMYVTVLRRKIEVGEVIAITTSDAVGGMYDGYTLSIFDTAFRVEPSADPGSDGGSEGDDDGDPGLEGEGDAD